MGQLISRNWKKIKCNKEVKIFMIGLDGPGKTTILYKMKLVDVVDTVHTIGCNVENIKFRHIIYNVGIMRLGQTLITTF